MEAQNEDSCLQYLISQWSLLLKWTVARQEFLMIKMVIGNVPLPEAEGKTVGSQPCFEEREFF